MNPYKQKRQEFFRKYFDYPSRLEIAIKKTEPLIYFEQQIAGAEVQNVRYFNSTKEILRLLNKHGYLKHFYWAYHYRNRYRIWNSARISWEPTKGLFIALDWLQHSDDEQDYWLDYEVTEREFDFFYPKRRLLFSNFYPSYFLKLAKDEDFFVLVADNRLNKMVEWS
jgi:hypothetical protein